MSANHDEMANAIRFLTVDAVQKANSGHPGMPLGMADVATVLFTKFMKYNTDVPDWADRDRFVLSAGHGSMLLYSLLYLTGYPGMTKEEISNFRQLGFKTAGHPEYGRIPGVEITTGPLGQGIASAVGMALAERMMNAHYGDDLVNYYTYVIAGDGCLMEGISQEAASIAGHFKLSRLIVLWDDNKASIDGPTDLSSSEDCLARFAASGWNTNTIDGHDANTIETAIATARTSDKPTIISCRTKIGFGAPTLVGSHKTHGTPLGNEEISAMRKALNWPYPPFEIPKSIIVAWRSAGSKGKADYKAWTRRLAVSSKKDELNAVTAKKLPIGWETTLDDYKKKISTETTNKATRQASGAVLEVLTKAIPAMVGGSADLTDSVYTKTSFMSAISAENYHGRYIHYGVREHAMAAIMNGMALHGGFIPYSGTFLVFADYMRGAMRLSALMGLQVIYVLTHDSIGVGEDGPTHQPVETIASLRSIPNFNVYRPADAIETAECWACGLQTPHTPSGIILSRQSLPMVRTHYTKENLCAKGGYVLYEAEKDRKVTLMATGSEVSIAIKARHTLQAEGIPTAVVSMPCFELFDTQDAAYKASVLGDGTIQVACEAAIVMGWEKYLKDNNSFVGMSSFGVSAPGPELYKHFDITAEAVVRKVKERL